MVNTFVDEYIILRLVQRATDVMDGIRGKKALQMSVYFFNQRHRCFYYKWEYSGPFSVEVQHIVLDFVDKKKIMVADVQSHESNSSIKNMKYYGGDYPDFRDFPAEFDKTLDSTIRFIRDKKSGDLELLVSVHFLADAQTGFEGKYDAEFVYKRLSALNPDAGFTKKDVTDSFEVLEKNGFLGPSQTA